MRALLSCLLLVACGAEDLSDTRYRFIVHNFTGQTIDNGDVCFDDGVETACLQVGPLPANGETEVRIWGPSQPIEGEPSVSAGVTGVGADGTVYTTDMLSFTGAAVDTASDYIVPLLDAEFTVTAADAL